MMLKKKKTLKTRSSIAVDEDNNYYKDEGVQLECLTALKQRATRVHATWSLILLFYLSRTLWVIIRKFQGWRKVLIFTKKLAAMTKVKSSPK